MDRKRFLVLSSFLTLVLTLVFSNAVAANSYGSDVSKQLSEVRQVTAKYHDIQAAFADGYVTDYHIVPNMGIHVVKPELIGDGILDPLAPEVLVYDPKKNGDYKLVAVEYLTVGGARPSLFGQLFDDGPFPNSFALHAWIWQGNPDGKFNATNPNVANN